MYSLGIFSEYVKYTQMYMTLPCYRMLAENAKTISTTIILFSEYVNMQSTFALKKALFNFFVQ